MSVRAPGFLLCSVRQQSADLGLNVILNGVNRLGCVNGGDVVIASYLKVGPVHGFLIGLVSHFECIRRAEVSSLCDSSCSAVRIIHREDKCVVGGEVVFTYVAAGELANGCERNTFAVPLIGFGRKIVSGAEYPCPAGEFFSCLKPYLTPTCSKK